MATWVEPTDNTGAFVIRAWTQDDDTTVSSDEFDDAHALSAWRDVNADGAAEFVGHNVCVGADGTTIAHVPGTFGSSTAMAAHGDFDDDGDIEVASTHGIWDALTGDLVPWSGLSELTFRGGAVQIDGEVALLGTDGAGAFRAKPDGEVVWYFPFPGFDQEDIAIGDVDGDSVPELAVGALGGLWLFDANGVVRWRVDVGTAGDIAEATAVVMADLDADGAYEIVTHGGSGLRLFRGIDGTLLAEDLSIGNTSISASPVIADVDADGSAEIVVLSQVRDTEQWVLRSYGPAEGRWARTRPVWNQLDYDVTTIQDDGRLAVWPIPNWETYNSFRAQPAHDGANPDLTVQATDLCCDADTVQLAVQPSNLGSVDALAGATITLTTNDGTGWRTVATHILAEGIEANIAAAGFVFSVPRADWGNLQVLHITGTDGDECDFVNDRVPVDLVCAE